VWRFMMLGTLLVLRCFVTAFARVDVSMSKPQGLYLPYFA
jgi:hypothetical protein